MRCRRETARERGASEVLSVLLMVSVTIVLAAMVGSVMLNVVGEVGDDPIAGTTIEFSSDTDEIDVVFTATQEKDTEVEVRVIDTNCKATIPEVGEDVQFKLQSASGPNNCLPGEGDYTVRVVAKSTDGGRVVVQERDGSI